MTKKILIVGAGIAGLSAGIHGCRNGYSVELFEMHNQPGGLCAAWDRKGYTFDGCIHWLVGSKPGSQFNRLWHEVGALKDTKIIDHEIFMTIENGNGKSLHIYSDLDRLQTQLLELAPEDEIPVKQLIDAAKTMSKLDLPLEKPDEFFRFWDIPVMMVKMMPLFKILGRFSRITVAEFIAELKNPFLKEALARILPVNYTMTSLISTLASLHGKDAGFPEGGSLPFALALEKCFLDLGGRIHYNSKVNQIIIRDNQAYGLRLGDGKEIQGDYIISAADLHSTLYELLGGKYLTPLIKDSFANLPCYTSAQVNLGVDVDLSREDKRLVVRLDNPIDLGSGPNRYAYLTNYSFDPTLAPAGKSALSAMVYSAYEYWGSPTGNKERYREKKEQLAEKLTKAAVKRFPAIKDKIEVTDVVTPLTYNRYTAVWKGAYMAWIVPPSAGRFNIPRKLPDLDHFYLAGQWVSPPAGLPGSMLTGRHLIQVLCRKDKKRFVSN
jgi:phytoene dehydrogenase-like protein